MNLLAAEELWQTAAPCHCCRKCMQCDEAGPLESGWVMRQSSQNRISGSVGT